MQELNRTDGVFNVTTDAFGKINLHIARGKRQSQGGLQGNGVKSDAQTRSVHAAAEPYWIALAISGRAPRRSSTPSLREEL